VSAFVDRGVLRDQPRGKLMSVNLGLLDRIRYVFFQAAPHLSSRGQVDPLPDPLLLGKFGDAGNPTRELWIYGQEL
jgi:hypothetical protein